jgi:hypothetical protein
LLALGGSVIPQGWLAISHAVVSLPIIILLVIEVGVLVIALLELVIGPSVEVLVFTIVEEVLVVRRH